MGFRKFEVNMAGNAKINDKAISYALNSLNGKEDSKSKAVWSAISKGFQSDSGSRENLQSRIALNSIIESTVPSKVTADLNGLLAFYAEVHNVDLNDIATIKTYSRERVKPVAGAAGTSRTRQEIVDKNVAVAQADYTGFGGMDYRKMANDPSGEFNSLLGKVTVDVRNSILVDTQLSLVNGVKDNVGKTGIKYLEASGITETNLNTVLDEVFVEADGGVTIFGDRKVTRQISAFTGISNRSSEEAL